MESITINRKYLMGHFQTLALAWVICAIFGALNLTVVDAQTNAGAATQNIAKEIVFAKAGLIERYDENGQWRKVPRQIVVVAEQADRLAHFFPELFLPPPSVGSSTFDPMRVQINFTQADGAVHNIYLNPPMNKWWDDRKVNELGQPAAAAVRELLKSAEDAPSLVNPSPVIRFDVADREDGYGRLRQTPIHFVATGRLAAAYAEEFPEIGLRREPQIAHGGGYRFKIIITRAGQYSTHSVCN